MKHPILFIFTFFALSATRLTAQEPSVGQVDNAVEEVAKKYLKDYSDQTPGALIAVYRSDTPLFVGHAGSARLSSDLKLDAHVPVRLASLSKQFIAVAIMLLVEDGKLSLDDPVTKHIPEFKAYPHKITVRQLLQHTSGLPRYFELFTQHKRIKPEDGFGFAPAGSKKFEFVPTNQDVIDIIAEFPKPIFKPGTRWQYSNSAYIVLSEIAERASKQSLHEFMRNRVFKPMKMSSSWVVGDSNGDKSKSAYSYRVEKNKFHEGVDSAYNDLYGDGGIFASLDDLVKWRKVWQPGVVLTQQSLDTIIERAKLEDGTVIKETLFGTGYGMGWFVDDRSDGMTEWLHGGGWAHFRHAIHVIPEKQIWVVVLTNRSDTQPYTMAKELAEAALKVPN